MADKKKPASKKASPEKSGSKAVARRASSEVTQTNSVKEYEEKNIVISQPVVHSGPLPSPDDFSKYNKGLLNAAERIMRMAERGQILRFIERFGGQFLAFLLGTGTLVLLGFIAFKAPSPYAFPSGIAGVGVVVVSTLVYLVKGGKKD